MNGWRDTTLGEEIELAYGKSLPAHARQPGRFGVFGSNGMVGTHVEAYVEGPGIVVGRKGSVGEVTYCADSFWPIDTTYYVINRGKHNWRFLYHLLRHCDLTSLNSHSAVPGLNREDVYSIPVKLPWRDEQDDIANVLDCLDNSIRLETDAKTLAQDLKRAAMRELFTRGLRGEPQKETEIGPVPESWDVVTIGSLFSIVQGLSLKGNLSDDGSGVPFLRTSNVYWGRIELASVSRMHVPLSAIGDKLLVPGDLLVCEGGEIGRAAVWEGGVQLCTFQNHLHRLRPLDAERIEPKFAMAWLEVGFCHRCVYEGAGNKTTIPNLSRARLAELMMPVPTLDEQREIVAILDAIDRKIELHRKKRAVLEELFKALLHKLMTGEIRVDQLDLAALSADEAPASAREEAGV